MNLLCSIGIHKRVTKQIFRCDTEFSSLAEYGDICERCGDLPEVQRESAQSAAAYCALMRGRVQYEITLHPSVTAKDGVA